MIPSTRRLTAPEFKQNNGKVFHSPLFVVKKNLSQPNNKSKFGVVVSKKISPKAVDRNKIRRRVYEAVREVLPDTENGYKVILYAKQPIKTADLPTIKKEIKPLFTTMGLFKS